MEYLRQMLSKAGCQGFTTETGSLTCVQGAAQGMTLPAGTTSANAALSAAKTTVAYRFDSWYKALDTELRAATNELFYQGGTADKFCTRMQTAADAIKKDPSITKFKR
jgi:N-acetylglucosamine transport system substrate-binding protein